MSVANLPFGVINGLLDRSLTDSLGGRIRKLLCQWSHNLGLKTVENHKSCWVEKSCNSTPKSCLDSIKSVEEFGSKDLFLRKFLLKAMVCYPGV